MNTRYIIILVALLTSCSAALAQQHAPRKEDIISVVYEFTLTADGKPHDIKVSQAFWQKDHSNALSVLSDAEKTHGASLIVSHPYHPRPDQVGKKRYDFVLFDSKSRQFNRGTRPH
jgi:predicted N-formylglutamate amidohydrolase